MLRRPQYRSPRFLYAPHALLFDRPKNSSADLPLLDETRAFLSDYATEWHWFGSDMGVFLRALFQLPHSFGGAQRSIWLPG